MGCSSSVVASSRDEFKDPLIIKVDETWERVWKTCDVKRGQKNTKAKDLVVKRTGWKTIRIFVSSTFKDFHPEREVLVKKVFPDLRAWCQSRRLHLIECDLRWGVPKDAGNEEILRSCLSEIDRCYQDNIMPYFVNMTSERIGWVPALSDIPEHLKDEYQWIEGLSVTEMEIMHAAYRNDNPNALFLLRDPAFLKDVPEKHKERFIDSEKLPQYKLQTLKKMIDERFKKNRVKRYECEFGGVNPETDMVELQGLDKTFSTAVFKFFKDRISLQYPLTNDKLDPYQQELEQHEAFMKSRSESVLGREDIIKEVDEYICGLGQDHPLLVVGGAGCGKSSIMARIADLTVIKAANGKIPGAKDKGWYVFYHFVGAVPGSTELEKILKRFLWETKIANKSNMPTDLDSAAQMTCGVLNNPNTRPCIIIIDALNQLDDYQAAQMMSWVPRKLAPHIRLVLSMIPDTPQHKNMKDREPKPTIVKVVPLDITARQAIVKETLGKYNKRLDDQQMESLLNKRSSENPLWLSIACEELRVFGNFRKLSDKINLLADGLLQLEGQVIERFERESGGKLLTATLCLLECSATGLLETELLQILGDEDNLLPPEEGKDEKSEKDDSKREKTAKEIGPLPFYKWADVFRALRPFLRPFGDSGEGRLDFYHRSLSKAVRLKYFNKNQDASRTYQWWHSKLADFFESSPVLERKVEEYPHHLVKLGDMDRLKNFLLDWEVVDQLFNMEFSSTLVAYWRKVGYDTMDEVYKTTMENLVNSGKLSKDDLNKRYEQACRILLQCGRYNTANDHLFPQLMKLEEELGSRPERMAELYHLKASAMDEIMKLEDFMYRSQMPRIKLIIESFNKSADLRRTLPGDEQKFKLGLVLNRLSFYYSSWHIRGGNDEMSAAEANELSAKSIDEAIQIFTELKRDVHLGDAYTTKGVSYGRACSEQIKNYEMARAILLQAVGELHHFMDRLYLNMGIYYEENGDYYKAYDMFYKWYFVCRELFGYEHSRTKRPIKTLLEPMYKRIAQEKGQSLPGHETGEEDATSMRSEDNLGHNNEDESPETDDNVEGQTEDGDNNTPDDEIRLNYALDPDSFI